ncbi:hypothetical protein LUX33_47985 [Actinomadura madurae]|nr:hypothetical protein [Actinomadura madurae]MCP9955339.1 hypothetical protein [Actinomadura madurae]
MASQREEVVVHADRGVAEQLREGVAERLLVLGLRTPARAVAAGAAGGGQGRAVELAVGGQRKGVDGDHRRGKHVVRQPFGGERPHRVGQFARFPAVAPGVGGDDVADQARVSGDVLAGDHGGARRPGGAR